MFPESFGLVAEGAQTMVELVHCGAQGSGLGGEASPFGHGSRAELRELGVLNRKGCGFFFAAEFFCSGGCELLVELLDALVLTVVDTVGLLEV